MKNAALFLVLLVALVGAANAAPPALSGPAIFVVADCGNARVVLHFTADPAPLAIRTGDITTEDPAAAPVRWSVDWDKPFLSEESIGEYQATGRVENGCPAPGKYRVPLVVLTAGAPPDARPLAITIVRKVDPVLDAPASVTLVLERWPVIQSTIGNPALFIPLREVSDAATLARVVATGTELKSASGEFTGIRLIPPSQPFDIGPGSGVDLDLALSGIPDPGTYTSSLILHMPALAQNRNIDVTVRARVVWGFLLAVLLAGVALGWLVNVRLAQQAALGAALLEGLRAAAAIAQRAALQKDPAVQQRLMSVAAALEGRVRGAATPEAAQAAVTAAQGQATAIEQRAGAAEAVFQQQMTRVRAVLTPDNQPLDAAIETVLAPLRAGLEAIGRTGSSGDVEEAQRRLDGFGQTLPRDAVARLQPWLRDLHAALDEFGPWAEPEQEPEKTRAALNALLQTAYPIADPGQLVRQSDAIARQLRAWVILAAPSGMARTFRTAATVLRRGNRIDLADRLATKADDAMRLGADSQDLIASLQALAALRHEVETMLRTAAPDNDAVEKALIDGDFAAAAAALVPREGVGAVAAIAALQPLQRPQTALAEVPPPAISPRLILPPQLNVGQPVRAILDWAGILPTGMPQWSCAPPEAAEIADADATGARITPRSAGLLDISADFPGADPITATAYVGEVTAARDYTAIAASAARVNGYIATATAILTVFAGYEIFIGSWVGTFADFFTAFLWGFFGQFGLDRIRDLAKPITSKALP